MHDRNRQLTINLPTPDQLDPNRANASRIEALRTAFGLEAQFDQSVGVKNRLALDQNKQQAAQQAQAQRDLEARRAELAGTQWEIAQLDEQIAVLTEENGQSEARRKVSKPPGRPTAEDDERALQLAKLKARRASAAARQTSLEGEVSSLSTAASTAPATPALATPELSAGSAGLPTSTAFDDFLKKAVDQIGQPNLAPSIALDNFVQMQYEIIAKQLTLLRDEVGPDQRVVFLELPASIYSVDRWGDGYVAKVEWRVSRYFEHCKPSTPCAEEEEREGTEAGPKNGARADDDAVRQQMLTELAKEEEQQSEEYACAGVSGKELSGSDRSSRARLDRAMDRLKRRLAPGGGEEKARVGSLQSEPAALGDVDLQRCRLAVDEAQGTRNLRVPRRQRGAR